MIQSYFEGLRKEKWSKELKDYPLHVRDLYIIHNKMIWNLESYQFNF